MANFLVTSSPDALNQTAAEADSIQQNNQRKTMASNALVAQYGNQAADPDMWNSAVNADTNSQTAPFKVQDAQQNAQAGALQLDQAQRANQAWQGQHAVSFIKQQIDNGVDPAVAVGNLTPDTYKALGINPDQVGGLVQAIKANPKVLDQIGDALTGDAGQSKMVGGVQWATDKDGKYHAFYPMQGKDGSISYQEPGDLPAGYSLLGSTPTQAAAANTAATKAAQGAAEYTNLKAEDAATAIKSIFPNAVITGGGRSAARNAQVGGAPNSMHLSDQALDFQVPGMTGAQVKAELIKRGYPLTEFLDEGQVGDQGPHLHWGWAPKATAAQKNLDNGTTAATIALHSAATAELRAKAGGAGGSLSSNTVNYLADQYRTTGKLPALGVGGSTMRAQILDAAAQKATAEGANGQADAFRAQATHERGVAVADLGKSTPTSAGGRVSSANALVAHLDQLNSLGQGLSSGNLPAINAAQQAYMKATGSPAPTNFNAVKQIAADEAVKFIVANGGTLDDRKKAQEMFNGAQSPQQLSGAIQQVYHLAGGQLGGMRQRYQGINATNEFDATLTPRTKQIMGLGQPTPAAAPPPPATTALRSKYGMQ